MLLSGLLKNVAPYPSGRAFSHRGGRACAWDTGRRRRRKCRAFTLVEVMAATAVMALSIGVGVVTLQIGMRNLELARTSTAAAQVLQNEAERLRLLNWSGVLALPGSENLNVPAAFAGNALPAGRITFSRTVSDVANFNDMKEILLRATWTSIDGQTHERVFRLRYAKGGIHDYYYGSNS